MNDVNLIIELDNLIDQKERVLRDIENLKEKKVFISKKHKALRENLNTLKKELELLKKELDATKELIETSKSKILAIDKAFNTIKSKEHYKALLKEKAKLEKLIIDSNQNIFSLEKSIGQKASELEKFLISYKAFLKQSKEELCDIRSDLKYDINLLNKVERDIEKIKQKIDKETLLWYENLFKKYGPPVIGFLKDGFCPHCSYHLPSSFYNDMIKNKPSIKACPYCKKIIIYE